MGRRNGLPTTYDLFIIGEQLRCQMTSAGLIKDNRYHLRKHRQCFVAKDAIDWVLKMHHVDTRKEAVDAMFILQEFNVIRHVTDDQHFKDKNTLFRFTKDDDTYRADRELKAFYRGLEIYDSIKKRGKDVLRNVYFKGDLHSNVFHGDDLVDFLQEWEGNLDRQEVVEDLKDLLTRDVIKHLTDESHFVDDKICYKFNIDFYKSCLLHEVLDIIDCFNSVPVPVKKSEVEEDSSPSDKEYSDESEDEEKESLVPKDNELPITAHPRKLIPVHRSGNRNYVKDLTDQKLKQTEEYLDKVADLQRQYNESKRGYAKSVVKNQDNTSTSQNQNERICQLNCDNIGFGLTLRGSSPCYIHAIAPLGPAAKAKVKVGHAVTSVNGQSVYDMEHTKVGILIAQREGVGSSLILGISLRPRRHQS